jgi:peptidoglycan/xylan/chitin deacetylase (PgdA/CDA1 family)
MTPRRFPRGLPVLTYHGFGPRESVTVTDPSRFADTLAAFLDAGYRAVDLADWVARGRPHEPRGFALALDDGLASVLRVAGVMERYGVPATLFLVAGRIGTDNAWPGQRRDVPRERLLSWPEIDALARVGTCPAAHGRTHRRLDRLAPGPLLEELQSARATIEARTGRPCDLLAYPYGAAPRRVRQAARRTYAAAFGTELGYAHSGEDASHLSRIDAYYLRSDRALRRLVEGHAGAWLRWRESLRAVRRRAEPILRLSTRREAA